jgi:hypothetical protein
MLLALTLSAYATDYTDLAAWEAAAGDVVSFDYTDLPFGTVMSMPHFGYLFSGGDDVIGDATGLVPDAHVVMGGAEIRIMLFTPATAVAVDYLDGAVIELLDAAGYVVGTSAWFGGPGQYGFGGIVSSQTFTTIRIRDWSDGYSNVNIDNLYVGRAPLALTMEGACPTAVSVTAVGFAPHADVAVLSSSGPGSSTIPVGPCAGTEIALSPVGLRLRTVRESNSDGEILYNGPVRPARCTETYQFLDLATCRVSNVDAF